MAQALLDKFNYRIKKEDKSIQTGDMNERCITISNTKKIQLYYSKSFKDYIVSFNINKNKKFILTKDKWLIFRKHIEEFDEIMTQE